LAFFPSLRNLIRCESNQSFYLLLELKIWDFDGLNVVFKTPNDKQSKMFRDPEGLSCSDWLKVTGRSCIWSKVLRFRPPSILECPCRMLG
jgi:hypothetical protein